MRVLLVANPDSFHTSKWANALVRDGHEVHLAYISHHDPKLNALDSNICLHELPFSGSKGYILNVRSLRKLNKNIKPDVVHAHYASGYGSLLRFSRITSLLSAWGSDVYEVPERSRLSAYVVRQNLLYSRHVFSTSACMRDRIRALVDDPNFEVEVTPFGVDLNEFSRAKYPPRGNSNLIKIGVVKNLQKTYGLDVLIRAAAMLPALVGEAKFEVRIYGAGSQEFELKALIHSLGLTAAVKLMGAIPNQDVPRVLSELDIYCVTSRRESFGVAAVEAMAMSLPVIVSDADGLREVVGDAGIVVPREDIGATARALSQLLLNPTMRTSLGMAARQRVEREYDWELTYRQILARYALCQTSREIR